MIHYDIGRVQAENLIGQLLTLHTFSLATAAAAPIECNALLSHAQSLLGRTILTLQLYNRNKGNVKSLRGGGSTDFGASPFLAAP